jgi:hypothetical protein
LIPPSKVLVKIGIERHGRKASGAGRGPPIHGRRRPNADLLAQHLQRGPIGAVRNLWDYRSLTPFVRYSSSWGSSDKVERRSQLVEVRQFIEGAARPPSERLAPHLQGYPTGAVRHFWDYRGLRPPSKVLVKIRIERHGRKAIATGRGPPIYRRLRQDRRSLGSTPSTRPDRCSTQPLGLPKLDAFCKVLVKLGIERHGQKASGTGRGPPPPRGRRPHCRALGSAPSTRPARCSTQPLGLPRLDTSF